jgi:hypothetical protein
MINKPPSQRDGLLYRSVFVQKGTGVIGYPCCFKTHALTFSEAQGRGRSPPLSQGDTIVAPQWCPVFLFASADKPRSVRDRRTELEFRTALIHGCPCSILRPDASVPGEHATKSGHAGWHGLMSSYYFCSLG